ncbi:TPA: isoleucine--tRNA ligase [Candidatus Woesearchaeota archaeon]|nr:isoleucine--tRNA ligase [Candidatus Woesearchaeota archaeon]
MNDIGNYNFKAAEEGTIKFWEDNKVYQKAKAKGKGKKPFFFIQGPPYTSGKLHMGHAWNNSLKDMVLRYKRMRGFDVFDRAAYDMHGLPTERKVAALHKLDMKEDILKFGVEKFVKECIKWSLEKADDMNKDLWRTGVWMDYSDYAKPIDNSYIEGEWFLIKKAHEKGRLYEGLRTMSWCASCQTAMAKHECEYKEVKEPSIFVKFPVKGKDKEFLIIWTTTPWTIAYNLAIMVHPELDYVKAKVGDEIWILAKQLAAPVIQTFTDYTLEVLDEFKGADLEGLEYTHPWDNKWNHYKEIKAQHPKAHTVLLSSEYVNLSAGSGLVHCAPGCGPEDYEVGYANNIPAFNNLREDGVFPEDMGEFAGLKAKKDDLKFVEAMKKDGILVATTEVEHDYAHCERCHNPVVFRTTKQWFFKVEDLKERMLKANEKIHWVPDSAGRAMHGWLDHLRDNSITKQRYWGTPVPIWKCPTCDKYEVIGSALELKEKAGHCPENLHKPWIDDVKISCDCGDMMHRLPDILDVWIDAGTLSWNILNYPSDKELFEKLYPADFILEAKEQVRGWFNLLLVTSYLAFDKPSFKACYVHGMLTDVGVNKMSKSLGNVISPYELIDKHGADTLRYYMMATTAGEDVNFSWEEAKLRNRNLGVLWNMHKYLIERGRLNGFGLKDAKDLSKIDDVERYMLSKTHSTLQKVTSLMEVYHLDEVPSLVADLFLELSRTYIQLTRDKSSSESIDERRAVFATIYNSLMESIKMFSVVCPFITDAIYQNLRSEYGLEAESIHLTDWSEPVSSLIDTALESRFEHAKSCIQAVLAAREKAQLGVRWPVGDVMVVTKDDDAKQGIEHFAGLIKVQTNVKNLTVAPLFKDVRVTAKPDYAKIGPEFGDRSASIIAKLSLVSPESILGKIESDGKYILDADGEKVEILKKHLIVKREVPEHFVESEMRGGFTYLDKRRSDELDNEGFARELMRRIQSMRKEFSLVKTDRISAYVKVSGDLAPRLKSWTDAVKDKVGASQLVISANEPGRMHQHRSKFKIKDQELVVDFDKL